LVTAQKYNERYLASTELTVEERSAAELVQAAIFFKLGDAENCRKALALVSNKSPSYPAALMLDATTAGVAEGFAAITNAATPAICGAAADVP
jgi:hypothetical protein